MDEWKDGWIINEWQEESGPSTLKGQLNILYNIQWSGHKSFFPFILKISCELPKEKRLIRQKNAYIYSISIPSCECVLF